MIKPRSTNEEKLTVVFIIEFIMICGTLSCSKKTMIRTGVTEYDKQIIMAMHNRMRQAVALGHIANQPPAANMRELEWDDELAAKAQQWAACESHSHDSRRHTWRYLVGQNMAASWITRSPSNFYDPNADFSKDAITKWFNEYKHFNNFGRIGFGGALTGHYTQLVWADTSTIGCGYACYWNPSKGFTKNYVCNYGPSGNVQGELPYLRGYPNCHNYGLISSKNYHGLCKEPNNNNFYSVFHFLR